MRGQSPQPFKFKILDLLAAIGRCAGVAEILSMKFSGWLWRGIYFSKLPRLPKVSARRARLEILDMVFSKNIVQLPMLRSPTISRAEEAPKPENTNNRPTAEPEEDEV
jgi:hypothetical protein